MTALTIRTIAGAFIAILLMWAMLEVVGYFSSRDETELSEPVVTEPILTYVEWDSLLAVGASETAWLVDIDAPSALSEGSVATVAMVEAEVGDTTPAALHATSTAFTERAITLTQCLNGVGVIVTRETLLTQVERHDWGRHSASTVTDVFMAESGGCVQVVSVTDDWGVCQVHRGELDRDWVDFPRLISDVGYAVEVCNRIYWKRVEAGLCGGCAWVAGRGLMW